MSDPGELSWAHRRASACSRGRRLNIDQHFRILDSFQCVKSGLGFSFDGGRNIWIISGDGQLNAHLPFLDGDGFDQPE